MREAHASAPFRPFAGSNDRACVDFPAINHSINGCVGESVAQSCMRARPQNSLSRSVCIIHNNTGFHVFHTGQQYFWDLAFALQAAPISLCIESNHLAHPDRVRSGGPILLALAHALRAHNVTLSQKCPSCGVAVEMRQLLNVFFGFRHATHALAASLLALCERRLGETPTLFPAARAALQAARHRASHGARKVLLIQRADVKRRLTVLNVSSSGLDVEVANVTNDLCDTLASTWGSRAPYILTPHGAQLTNRFLIDTCHSCLIEVFPPFYHNFIYTMHSGPRTALRHVHVQGEAVMPVTDQVACTLRTACSSSPPFPEWARVDCMRAAQSAAGAFTTGGGGVARSLPNVITAATLRRAMRACDAFPAPSDCNAPRVRKLTRE